MEFIRSVEWLCMSISWYRDLMGGFTQCCDNVSLGYKLTEKLIAVAKRMVEMSCACSINLYFLIQHSFAFTIFLVPLAHVVGEVRSLLQASFWRTTCLNSSNKFSISFPSSAICQVSYLRWHKFMMIFHVANQKSTQKFIYKTCS